MTPIYDQPVWQIMIECIKQMPDTFTVDDVVRWFANSYPKISPVTARDALKGACVNLGMDPVMRSGRPQRLVAYKLGRSRYTRYSPDIHGEFDDRGRPLDDLDDADITYAGSADVTLPRDILATPAAAEFALEMHLEEFIEANWQHIDFGVPLNIYSEDGTVVGRQYRTDVGLIDFLCRNPDTGDFWVLELKRGESSDKVIGQLLRYMGWVQKNLAKERAVHGLIIAHEQDERLQYAVSMVQNVEAWTYRVKFEFNRESVAV